MNNQKLVDAIGLLDDEMIVNARNAKIKRYPLAVKIAAAVIAVLLVPAAVIFGGGYIFGHIGSSACDPALKYAFTEEALMEICQQPMGSVCMTSNPPVYFSVSAMPPEIHYVDKDKIVFTTLEGVFVYNYNTLQIEKSFSLDKIGIPHFSQGDVATDISVDVSGDYALLTSSENMSSADRELEYRILDFISGKVEKIESSQIPENFKAFKTEENIYKPLSDSELEFEFYEAKDFPSSQMVSLGDKDFFLVIDVGESEAFNALLGYAEVIIVNPDKSFTSKSLFTDFSESVVK